MKTIIYRPLLKTACGCFIIVLNLLLSLPSLAFTPDEPSKAPDLSKKLSITGPQVGVSLTSLDVDMLTGVDVYETLTISNTGDQALTFSFSITESYHPQNFIFSPSSGEVPAGSSVNVGIRIWSLNLYADVYTGKVNVHTNDLVNPTVVIPFTLTVTDNVSPVTTVFSHTLDFDNVPLGGSKKMLVTLRNATETFVTVTGISFSNSAFTSTDIFPLVFSGGSCGANHAIPVWFKPSAVGDIGGTLTILTNDPNNPVFTIALSGTGVSPANITVSSDTILASVVGSASMTIPVTVTNSGEANLEFYVNAGARAKPYGTPLLYLPKVLTLTSDTDADLIMYALYFYADVNVTVLPVASLPDVTVEQMLTYDVVYVKNNHPWSTAGVSAEFIGDLLADYIDQGGKLIIEQHAYSPNENKLEGRFISEQYGPFMPADSITFLGCAQIQGEENTLRPDHPLMTGDNNFLYGGDVGTVTLAPGAIQLADFTSGDIYAAVNQNVLGINALISPGDGTGFYWDGTFQDIYHRAIYWFGGASYLNIAPSKNILAPGQQITLQVAIEPANFPNGHYDATLDFVSNDPDQPIVTIPVILDHLPEPIVNQPPVLDPIDDMIITYGETPMVVVTATDPDDTDITVFMVDLPSFVMEGNSGDDEDYAFWIVTEFGTPPEFDLVLVARDPHGAADSLTVHVTVFPHGIQYFRILNVVTGEVLEYAHPSDVKTLDVARPDFNDIAIEGNPFSLNTVGSVAFTFDGKKKNVDNRPPFFFSPIPLATSANGPHTLSATTYTRTSARGESGREVTITLNLVNSAQVTNLEVVDRWGNKLMDLTDGAVIDINDPSFHYINIKAITTEFGVGRVLFSLNQKHTVDNSEPYSLAGGVQGNYKRWDAHPGSYVLEVTPKSNTYGKGVLGESKVVNFTVIQSEASSLAKNTSSDRTVHSEGEGVSITAYPNPAKSEFTLNVTGSVKGNVRIILYNTVGQPVYTHTTSAEELYGFRLSLTELNLMSGVYYIAIASENGIAKTLKIMKQ